MQAIQHDYAKADNAIISFLSSVGRRKFVLPLYKALFSNSRTAQLAKDTYIKLKPGYHSVTQQSVDEVFSMKWFWDFKMVNYWLGLQRNFKLWV